MTDEMHPFNRPYASNQRPANPREEDVDRGRKRRMIDLIADARKLGEELMDPWDEE